MFSSIISKIEKARRYVAEVDRFHFCSFQVSLEGNHRKHLVKYDTGNWHCDCDRFKVESDCAHTRASEQLIVREFGANLVGCKVESTPNIAATNSQPIPLDQQLYWNQIRRAMSVNEVSNELYWD